MSATAANPSNQVQTPRQFALSEASAVPSSEVAVLAAVIYADLFDYPLTEAQIAQYQVGTDFSRDEIQRALLALSTPAGPLVRLKDFFMLQGREDLLKVRHEREQASSRLWRRARVRARWVARTPFVHMVAVTGALSMDNIFGKPDIDLLVVASPGRVWICRRLLILQVRLARLLGDDLCPNYILSSSKLELDQRDFFTAHELAQMVPLYGHDFHREMLKQNAWAIRFLPAAFHESYRTRSKVPAAPPKLVERVLGSGVFDRWESWELRRLRRKLAPLLGEAAEVVCSPDQCKGHTGLHRSSVLTRFADRLKQVAIYNSFADLLEHTERIQKPDA